MRSFIILLFICLLSLLAYACIETYNPPEIEQNPNILVVDGFLDGTNGTCHVKLSRTQKLGDNKSAPLEISALIKLEEKNGNSYTLNLLPDGTYLYSGLTLTPKKEYRIYITTNGKEYASEYEILTSTPEIDSITWEPTELGVEIQVTTHDPIKESIYYQWMLEETWQYTSAFQSTMIYNNGTVSLRNDNIYNCWKNENPTNILIKSTASLKEDIVYKYPLLTLPKTTDKYRIRYSILVNQRVLTESAFYFWQQMQKNTENLGTLFDPQPTQIKGNIYNVNDASDPVLGYFSASYTRQKRLFLQYIDLPDGFPYNPNYEFQGCKEDTVLVRDLPKFYSNGYLLTSPITEGIFLIGYGYSTNNCVDCRTKGGTNIQPDFW